MSLASGADYDEILWRMVDEAVGLVGDSDGDVSLIDEAEFRRRAATFLQVLVPDADPRDAEEAVSACADDLYRYGPLSDLLNEPAVTDIVVNAPNEVFVDRGGGLVPVPASFRSREHLYAFAVRHLGRVGKVFNRSSPIADADLENGARLHVVSPPVTSQSVQLSIRRFRANFTLDQIVGTGMLSAADAAFLRDAVAARKNIVIAGGPGAGKTTLLASLLDEVDPRHRVVGIEDVPEIRPQRCHYVRLLTRRSTGPYVVETSVRDLVREALRMRPDRLVVGEVRGPEALDMVSAMTTGMDGSMTTIHASSAAGAIERLGSLLQIASGSAAAAQMARTAIDLVIFIRRDDRGQRLIEAIEKIGP